MTPKAAQIIEGDATRTEDEKFLEALPSPDFLQTDPWRTLRILSEFVEGFDAMAKVGPAITVFGSTYTNGSSSAPSFLPTLWTLVKISDGARSRASAS